MITIIRHTLIVLMLLTTIGILVGAVVTLFNNDLGASIAGDCIIAFVVMGCLAAVVSLIGSIATAMYTLFN